MLAVLHVALPFNLLVPEQTQFTLYSYSDGPYQVTPGLPVRSGRPLPGDAPEQFLMNGKPGFVADALTVTFRKDTFNRSLGSEIDPPYEVINRFLAYWLSRLKYLARAPQIHQIELPECQWRLKYLNDDETELQQEEGLLRGRGTISFAFSYIACSPELWDSVHSLAPDFEPPPWHALLIDSRGALPHVGTAVVLAAAALEVLVSDVLKHLFEQSAIPSDLWNWVIDRGDWQKEPSVEEQYSTLLKVLCGHSLKEDNALWEAFKNLRTARNSFVHEGVPKIGGAAVTTAGALTLIGKADQIAEKLRSWLPESIQWPQFTHEVQIEFRKRLTGDPSENSNDGAAPAAPSQESPSK